MMPEIILHYRDTGEAATACGMEAWTPKYPSTEVWNKVTCTDCLASRLTRPPADPPTELRMPEVPPGTAALTVPDSDEGRIRFIPAARDKHDTAWRDEATGVLYSFADILTTHLVVTVEKRKLRTWAPLDDAPADLTKVQLKLGDGCWSITIQRDEDNPQWWWHGAKRKSWPELRGSELREVL